MLDPELLVVKSKRERLQRIYPSREELECPTFLCFMKDHAHQRGEYVMIVNRTCMCFPKKLAEKIYILLVSDTLASG